MTLLLVTWTGSSAALDISNRYRSPRNPERRIRPATRLIILHTTEAHARSSLNKLSERGEAHYCLVENGTVYRIIDRDRVAFHAGRSMWNGKEDCDDYAIGIEVVGYHNKPMPLRQLAALRELVNHLKRIYGLSDVQVLCHSHVAYGAPNRWQKRRCRGRKRCGMLFAMWSVRTRIGLRARPAVDPDIRAGRLVQGDPYLHGVLYGKTDTMVAAYSGGRDPGVPSSSGGLFSGLGKMFGLTSEKKDSPPQPKKAAEKRSKASPKPAGAVASAQKGGMVTSADVPKGSFRTEAKKIGWTSGKVRNPSPPDKTVATGVGTDWFLLPDGRYFRDDCLPKNIKLPAATRRLIGYRLVGPLAAGQSAYGVVGKGWDDASTYYIFGGSVTPGDKVTAASIPTGARIFYRAHVNRTHE